MPTSGREHRRGPWQRLAGWLTGASFPAGLRSMMTWPGMGAIIVAVPVLVGVVVSLDAQQIASASGRFFRARWSGAPYLPAILVWTVSSGWLVLLYLRVVTEDFERRNEIEDLKRYQHDEIEALQIQMNRQMQMQADHFQRAIFRAPNVDVVLRYPTLYRKAAGTDGLQVSRLMVEKIAAGDMALARSAQLALEDPIRKVLLGIALMAKRFGRRPDEALYGCNVMLLESVDDEPHFAFRSLLHRPLLFSDRRLGDYGGFRAVLYTTNALTVDTSRDPDASDGTTALAYERQEIALPVPKPASPEYVPLILPGAPLVLEQGGGKVYPDTQVLVRQCESFSRRVRTEVEGYFASGDPAAMTQPGRGARIRSFASFRIGSDADPIGVINIDCDHTDLLGEAEEYSATFLALMTPWLVLLSRPVMTYSWLQTAIWNSEPPARS